MSKSSTKTQTLARLSIFSALILVLANIPIKVGAIEMTLAVIPVAVGAITMGPKYGMIMGAVFGTASLLQCFGIVVPSVFGQTVLAISPFFTVVLCYLPRVLMGMLVGLIFQALSKGGKANAFAYGFSAFSAAALNTLFFVPLAIAFFWNTDYFRTLCDFFGTNNVFVFAITFAGINAVVEAVVCCIVGGACAKTVDKIVKKQG